MCNGQVMRHSSVMNIFILIILQFVFTSVFLSFQTLKVTNFSSLNLEEDLE